VISAWTSPTRSKAVAAAKAGVVDALRDRIDVLVNNAGYGCSAESRGQRQGVEQQFANTNVSACERGRGGLPLHAQCGAAARWQHPALAGYFAFQAGASTSTKFAVEGAFEAMAIRARAVLGISCQPWSSRLRPHQLSRAEVVVTTRCRLPICKTWAERAAMGLSKTIGSR